MLANLKYGVEQSKIITTNTVIVLYLLWFAGPSGRAV